MMVLAFLAACQFFNSNSGSSTGFLGICSQPSTEEQKETLSVLFDRLSVDSCEQAHEALLKTKSLNLANHAVAYSDISMLSEFIQIEELYLSDSIVSDLTPISNMKGLKVLHLEHCDVDDISPLEGLNQLEVLLLDYTRVSDLSAIAQAKQIHQLGLRKTFVYSLSELSNFSQIRHLEISDTPVSDIGPLQSINTLEAISFRNTDVSDLASLSSHKQLFFLDAHNTKVTDVAPLSDLIDLKALDLSQTQVTDLSKLDKLVNLIEVKITDAPIDPSSCPSDSVFQNVCTQYGDDPFLKLCFEPQSFPFTTQSSLRSLQKDLETVDCLKLKKEINEIKTFSSERHYPDPRIFSLFPQIESLDLPLSTIWGSLCPAENVGQVLGALCARKQTAMQANIADLKEPFLEHCKDLGASELTIEFLSKQANVSECSELWTALSLKDRLILKGEGVVNISSLKFFKNLKELSLEYNNIVNIEPLSQLTELQILWIDDNEIQDLRPISDLDLLWLSAGDNQINKLTPLSSQKNLYRLWLGGNQIGSIDPLEDLVELRKLHLALNQVEDISVLSKLENLSSLYLGYNNIKDIRPLSGLEQLKVLNAGLDNDEAPLEVQRWFLKGNPIEATQCTDSDWPTAVQLYCAQL